MANKKFTYDDFIAKVSKCDKCGQGPREGKKCHPAFYKLTKQKVQPFVWNRKDVELDEIVGYCWMCREKSTQSNVAPSNGVSSVVPPTSNSSDAEKFKWVIDTAVRLTDEMTKVFGEPLSLAEAVKRANEWKKAAGQ